MRSNQLSYLAIPKTECKSNHFFHPCKPLRQEKSDLTVKSGLNPIYVTSHKEMNSPAKKEPCIASTIQGSLMVPGNQMTATRGVSVILPRFPFPSACQPRHYS